MTLIVSPTPISKAFYEKILTRIRSKTDCQKATLSELRQGGLVNMLKRLRSESDIYYVFEDSESIALSNVVKVISCMALGKNNYIVNDKENIVLLSWVEQLSALFSLMMISIASIVSAFRSRAFLVRREVKPVRALTEEDYRDIAYVNANAWFGVKVGGSVGHVSGVVNALDDLCKGITFYGFSSNPEIHENVKQDIVPFSGKWGMPSELNYYRLSWDFASSLLRRLAKAKPTLIYQRLSICNMSGLIAAKVLRVPLVVEYNGSEVWIAKHWGRPLKSHKLADRVETAMLMNADRVVTISEPLRRELLSRGVPEERLVCYPNCVDSKKFNPDIFTDVRKIELRRKWGIPDDAVVATFVGTFGVWHGAEKIAELIAQLLEKDRDWLIRNKVHFIFVGDGVKMAEVRGFINNPECEPFFTITGLVPQSDAPLFLASSDILLSPHVENKDGSEFFGSPTKLFEYMAMGKAIIASDLYQIGKVLKNSIRIKMDEECVSEATSEIAVLVQPGNLDELSLALRLLVENQTLRLRLGANARHEAESKYLWRHHVQEIMRNRE